MSKVYTIDDELAEVLWQAQFFCCTNEILRLLKKGATVEELMAVLKPHHDRIQRLDEEEAR